MQGYLSCKGHRVPQARVRASLRRVDPEGVEGRRFRKRWIRRVPYNVGGPQSLWHIDGYHKLIRYLFGTNGGSVSFDPGLF